MRTSRRGVRSVAALLGAVLLVVFGCGASGGGSAGERVSGVGGRLVAPGTLVVGVDGALPDFDPLGRAPGEVPALDAVMGLLAPGAFVTLPDGTVRHNPALLVEEPRLVSTAPQAVVYKIRARARWSDGMPVSVADFRYGWRIRSAATCPACRVADRAGYSAITDVTGADDGRTVTVTFGTRYAGWRDLFRTLLPAHVGARAGDTTTAAGLAASLGEWARRPDWSGGPYLVSAYRRDRQVELVPNPAWYGADHPALDKLVVRCFTDRAAMVAALADGTIGALRTTRPDPAIVASLAAEGAPSAPGVPGPAGVTYRVTAGRAWEHLDVNVADRYLADRALRLAVLTAVDARRVADAALARLMPDPRPRYAHTLFPGDPGYRDVLREASAGQGSGDLDRARRILVAGGYRLDRGVLYAPGGERVPALRLRYAAPGSPPPGPPPGGGDPGEGAVAELVRVELAQLGLTVLVEPADDLAATVARGEFALLLRAEPAPAGVVPAAQRWRDGAGGLGWRSPESDALLDRITSELDEIRLPALLNQQDEVLTRDAVVLPLFQLPSLFAAGSRYAGLEENAAGGVFTSTAARWHIRTG